MDTPRKQSHSRFGNERPGQVGGYWSRGGRGRLRVFCLGRPTAVEHFPWTLFVHTLLGTILVASGASTLNQLIERKFDARMRRTARRPIPAGRVEPFIGQ